MCALVRFIQVGLGFRVLLYIDYFIVGSSPPGSATAPSNVGYSRRVISKLMRRLRLQRQIGMGCWGGIQRIELLDFLIDTVYQRVYIAEKTVGRVHSMDSTILLLAQRNRPVVLTDLLR